MGQQSTDSPDSINVGLQNTQVVESQIFLLICCSSVNKKVLFLIKVTFNLKSISGSIKSLIGITAQFHFY